MRASPDWAARDTRAWARRVAMRPEARDASRLRLVGVDRERRRSCVRRDAPRDTCSRPARAAPRCRPDRTISGTCTPMVGCSADGGFHARIAHARDEFARHAGRGQRQHAAVAGDRVAAADHAGHLDLHALDGRIDVARGAGAADLLAQHVPGLDGLAQLERHAVVGHRAVAREAKLDERLEPRRRRTGSRARRGRARRRGCRRRRNAAAASGRAAPCPRARARPR